MRERAERRASPLPFAAVVDALLRLSALVELCPEIQELELNPLKVFQHGVYAVDVRVRVAQPTCTSDSSHFVLTVSVLLP